jgi:hypothetical protein
VQNSHVLRDPQQSTLLENEKALLRFVKKVTTALPSVTEDDSEILRELGWTHEAIYYTITVCALFKFFAIAG